MNRALMTICLFLLCSFSPREEKELMRTFDHYMLLLQKWLAGMHEVAKCKWNQGLIECDVTQEEKLIDHLSYLAASSGISDEWAEKVVRAQVDASRLVMSQDFEIWQRADCRELESWDLASELDPYLCMLTSEMFKLLGELFPNLDHLEERNIFIQPPLSRRAADRIPYPAWRKALSVFQNRSQR